MSWWESNTKIDRKGRGHGGGGVSCYQPGCVVNFGKDFVKMVKKQTQRFNVYYIPKYEQISTVNLY